MAFFSSLAPNTSSSSSTMRIMPKLDQPRQTTSYTNESSNSYTSPQTNSFSPPTTAFPSWMPTASQFGELQSTYKNIPKMFNTQGMEDSYGRMIQNNQASGAAMSATAGRAAQNRARQQGGQVGASFAQGSAMQNVRRQGAEMLGDLEQKKMAARAAQAQAQMQASGMLGQGRLAQQGQLAGYDQNMRQQYFQGQGLGMDQQRIGLQGAGLELQRQQMAQQGSQFDRSFGLQSKESDLRGMIAALQATPKPMGSWRQFEGGNPMTGYDQSLKTEYYNKAQSRDALVSKLANTAAGRGVSAVSKAINAMKAY